MNEVQDIAWHFYYFGPTENTCVKRTTTDPLCPVLALAPKGCDKKDLIPLDYPELGNIKAWTAPGDFRNNSAYRLLSVLVHRDSGATISEQPEGWVTFRAVQEDHKELEELIDGLGIKLG